MPSRLPDALRLDVAELTLSISGVPPESLLIDDALRDFRSDKEPDVHIRTHFDRVPELPLDGAKLVFDSESLWRLYEMDEQRIFTVASPVFGEEPYAVAVFDAAFTRGEVFDRRAHHRAWPEKRLPNPISYPLSEALMVCMLSRGHGLMTHACGVADQESGLLFAGNSTHGKSTMALQWEGEGLILNDDRIVLRYREGRPVMFGTPWHGAYTAVSPRGVSLEKLFFLRHADSNSATRLPPARAASMLLTRCFPPLWDEDGMRFTLDLCDRIVADVPCYDLGFRPDGSIVEYLRCAV